MQLHNTMTRTTEEFVPGDPAHAALYTCGPTVYDYPHIGNWAAYVRWDTLVRTLKLSGYTPNWVINITDVGHLVSDADHGEDKLEKSARREGKTAWDIARFYTEDFKQGLRSLNITPPDHLVLATEHIKEQIELVQTLEKKGHTYIIDDGVYFDTTTFPNYGQLARLDLDNLQAGARVEANEQKRHHTDFALWKFSPQGETRDMEWDSPWGKGFPGWHIECSAMAIKYLGETLDIHAGGIDHLPIHHTNEIAQSEAATGKPFAHYWLHSNFLNIDGRKISKSLGNIITLQDVAAKGFSLLDLRMLYLQSHYRTAADFTWETLQAARNYRLQLQNLAELRFQGVPFKADELVKIEKNITLALQTDLNTPQALRALNAGLTLAALDIAVRQEKLTSHTDDSSDFTTFLQFLDDAFGLQLLESKDITAAQKHLIRARNAARAERDFAKSDALRDELLAQNIALKDTPNGTVWYRTA